MHPEWLSSFPSWLVFGVLAGGCATVLIAGVFIIGGRLFPDDTDGSKTTAGRFNRRRGEFRSYLRSIDEPFVEEHELAGETIAFYLSDRNIALTFDAQVYFHLDHTSVETILCEHEMPVRALGRRLPFEVPNPNPNPNPNRNPNFDSNFGSSPETNNHSQIATITAAYAQLGLKTTADAEAVRDAYREQVKTAHPDHGGTQAEFNQLQEAYTTARNHAEQTEQTNRETVSQSD